MSKPTSPMRPARRLPAGVAGDADPSESAPTDRLLQRLLGLPANGAADDAPVQRRASRSRAVAGRGDRPAAFPFSLWKSG